MNWENGKCNGKKKIRLLTLFETGSMRRFPSRFITSQFTFVRYFFLGATAPLHGLKFNKRTESVQGVSASTSGVRTVPYILAVSKCIDNNPLSIFSLTPPPALCVVVVGQVISKTGYAFPWMILGAAVTAIGSGLIYTFDIDSPSSTWIGYQVFSSQITPPENSSLISFVHRFLLDWVSVSVSKSPSCLFRLPPRRPTCR
jgi:hypothetical protein